MKNTWMFILLMLFATSALSQSYMMLKIVKVYDGDTIKIDMTKLPPPLNKMSVRILGIDTPEMGWRAGCDAEHELAVDAKVFVEAMLEGHDRIKVTNYKWDKYGGRIDANVSAGGKDIASALIENGLAIEYDGGRKTHNWCE